MNVLIDIIGSLVVKIAIVAIIFNININLENALNQQTARATVKTELSSTAEIFLADIRLAGYGATSPFTIASASELQYTSDINNDGILPNEVVHYYVGSPSVLAAPDTHTVYILYRQVTGVGYSGIADVVGRNIDSLKFSYYDADGAVTAVLANIRSMKLKYSMYSTYQVNGVYLRCSWERKIFPRNLQLN